MQLGGAVASSALKNANQGPRKEVPTALQAVTLKAMALDPKERYQSVAELVADLEAYLHGFATQAEHAGLGRQIWLLIRRNKIASGFAALLLLCAAIFTVQLAKSEAKATQNALLAEKEADRATRNAQVAESNAQEAQTQSGIAQANSKRAEEQTVIAGASAKKALEEKELARRAAADANLSVAESAEENGRQQQMLKALAMVPEDLRGQPWRYLQSKVDTSFLTIMPELGTGWLRPVAHPSRPNTLLVPHFDGRIRLLDLATGSMADLLKIDISEAYLTKNPLAVSSDGTQLVALQSLKKPSGNSPLITLVINVFSIADKEPQCVMKFTCEVDNINKPSAVLNSDAGLLLLSFKGGGIFVFDTRTGSLLWRDGVDLVTSANFVGNGQEVYVFGDVSGISYRNSRTGKVLRSVSEERNRSYGAIYATDPNSKFLFYGENRFCRCINTKDGRLFSVLPVSARGFYGDMAYIPDQQLLALVDKQSFNSGVLQIWDPVNSKLLSSLQVTLDSNSTNQVDFGVIAPAKSDLIAVFKDSVMKVFKLSQLRSQNRIGNIEISVSCDNFAFLGQPDLVASAFRRASSSRKDGWTTVVSAKNISAPAAEDVEILGYGRPGHGLSGIVTTDQAGRLVCAGVNLQDDDTKEWVLKLFRLDGDRLSEIPLDYRDFTRGCAHLSPSGDLIWAGNAILKTSSGKKLRAVDLKGITRPDFSQIQPRWVGGSRVVEIAMTAQIQERAQQQRSLVLWNVEDGKQAAIVPAPNALSLAASPDGSQIAEGGSDKKLRIRDGKTLVEQRVLRVHDDAVLAVAWHPTLPLLATASADYTVKVWDLSSDTMVEKFGLFELTPDRLFWSPDGTQLAVRSKDREGYIDIIRPASCQK